MARPSCELSTAAVMTQADLGLNLSRKKTRKREFLEVMKRPEATGVT